MPIPTTLCWLRRDLRLDDHAALSLAQQHGRALLVFVFDPAQLAALAPDDARIGFIWQALLEIRQQLRAQGSDLVVCAGEPSEELATLAAKCGAQALYYARDYEAAALARDARVAQRLAAAGVACHSVKDQVIFEQGELLTGAGKPYTVFTPYARTWRRQLTVQATARWPVRLAPDALLPWQENDTVSPASLGFVTPDLGARGVRCAASGAQALLADFATRIDRYHVLRDFPAKKGVSYLSAHLRFGTVSIRQLVRLAVETGGAGADAWLNELVWREFYQQLLWHFPEVEHESFKPAYRDLAWPGHDEHFAAWCAGRTGYPLVDAAMRQLNQCGWMHNRLRMVSASFLVKDLLIDWRRGEAYFARQLLDFDLAANNGGWQWAASTGCDAQPWFRIFNPVTQSQKFDADGAFIRRYIPELAALDRQAIHAPWLAKALPPGFVPGRDYPHPIVEHAAQRERALALYGQRP